MGCGSRGDLFRLLEYGMIANRGYRGNQHDFSTHTSNSDTNLALLNKMFVSNLITEEEYLRNKHLVLSGSITFEELVRLQQKKKSEQTEQQSNTTKDVTHTTKIDRLQNSRDKIMKVFEDIDQNIAELNKQKQKIEMLLDEYIRHNEKKAEEYISKKIDIEESIQNLKRKQASLNEDLEDINQQIRLLKVEELELEANELHKELTKLKNN